MSLTTQKEVVPSGNPVVAEREKQSSLDSGTRRLRVSPHLGYHDQVVPGVPANAVLNFEVDLLEIHSQSEDAPSP
ncbi:MAG TPA: FKBP-type peptidyl-prolyl cis-trans isomerase [Gemmataceae bacterium]|nr:FKBP-type peptidyl-prolyl cis-trans isomerase [Gemmataceae bacterium]